MREEQHHMFKTSDSEELLKRKKQVENDMANTHEANIQIIEATLTRELKFLHV